MGVPFGRLAVVVIEFAGLIWQGFGVAAIC